MKLLKQNKPMCLLYAFAMVLDVEPATLVEETGTDGLEIWWPHNRGVHQYRGHHPQELIDCCTRRGKVVMTIEALPCLGSGKVILTPSKCQDRFNDYLNQYEGVITNPTHAVAWDRKKIYDPNGYIYDLHERFHGQYFFAVV